MSNNGYLPFPAQISLPLLLHLGQVFVKVGAIWLQRCPLIEALAVGDAPLHLHGEVPERVLELDVFVGLNILLQLLVPRDNLLQLVRLHLLKGQPSQLLAFARLVRLRASLEVGLIAGAAGLKALRLG